MNERIKELAEQCTSPEQFDVNKFAELVIRECANLVENEGRFTKYDSLANKIRNSFGIK